MESQLNLPINVMSRHIINCQLQELRNDLLPPGQNSKYHCLQVICSMVPSTQLSHTTLQFVRYATLLYNAKKLKDGELDEHILDSILIILVNITKAPELRLESLQDALGSLVMDTKSGLTQDGVDKYWKNLVAFVETILQCYSISPEMGKYLNGDAFSAKIPAGRKTRRNPGKDNVLTPSKRYKLVPELVPYVVVINPTSDGSYPSDLVLSEMDEAPKKIPLPSIPSVIPKVEVTQAVLEVNNAAIITDPSAVSNIITAHTGETVNYTIRGETSDRKVEGATGCRGIFDKARASSSEMEWTSDESDYILAENTEGLPKPLFSIECRESIIPTPPKVYRKKWTEEEHACLMEGVRILGEGKWKEIKNMFREVLKDRESGHLKDRYRNTEGRRGKKKDVKTKEQGTP